MMFPKLICGLAASGLLAFSTSQACAADGATEKKVEWHCEKNEGGKTVNVEAKDKNDCKQKGGKWVKADGDKHSHD